MPNPLPCDNVCNPWNKRDGVIVFDTETNYISDFSIDAKRNREFKCGVAYCYADGKYHRYTDPAAFVEFLKNAKVLVSYNGEGFDYIVLEKYGFPIKEADNERWVPDGIVSCDIMHKIQELRPEGIVTEKKYPRLDELIMSHYGVHKTPHDANDPDDLLKHCIEDVKFTKMLYEEETWIVPIKDRPESGRWSADYDNDLYGEVDYGEGTTRIVDFGMPLAYSNKFECYGGDETMSCPLCDKGGLSLHFILKGREDQLECPVCHGVIRFLAGTDEIMFAMSKEEFQKNICPNCGKHLERTGYAHHGYGAGEGYYSSGRNICKSCGKGCYEWDRDDTPGFREHFVGKCCHCGE